MHASSATSNTPLECLSQLAFVEVEMVQWNFSTRTDGRLLFQGGNHRRKFTGPTVDKGPF